MYQRNMDSLVVYNIEDLLVPHNKGLALITDVIQ